MATQRSAPQHPPIDWYERAVRRVDHSPALQPYRSMILADWPEGAEHWHWVATTARIREIVDWAQGCALMARRVC